MNKQCIQCPKCSGLIVPLESGSVTLAMCDACGYTRAHHTLHIWQEIFLDQCEYNRVDASKLKAPTTKEELQEWQGKSHA